MKVLWIFVELFATALATISLPAGTPKIGLPTGTPKIGVPTGTPNISVLTGASNISPLSGSPSSVPTGFQYNGAPTTCPQAGAPTRSIQPITGTAALTSAFGTAECLGNSLPQCFNQSTSSSSVNPALWNLTTPQLIEYYGYKVENHTVVTADGYILTLFRIPASKNGTNATFEPILLQHGLLSSSNEFVYYPFSLPFQLADRGYDVWIGNARGNFYSMNNTKLSPDDLEFWNWSYDEQGLYDLPAMMGCVLNNTNTNATKLSYIGHSMGCASFLAGMSMKPEMQAKVNKVVLLAPAAFLAHMKTLLSLLFALPPPAPQIVFNLLSQGRVFPANLQNVINEYFPPLCAISGITNQVCLSAVFALAGFNPCEYSPGTASMIYGHYPAPCSGKSIVHLMQAGNAYPGRIIDVEQCNGSNLNCSISFIEALQQPVFARFDYGCIGNLQRYNSSVPPSYNLSAITLDTLVMSSKNDYLVSDIDAEITFSKLGTPAANKRNLVVADCAYNHFDFLISPTMPENVGVHVLDFLPK